MIDEIDIYRTATVLIREHGDKAGIHSAMRADEMLDAGDMDGAFGGAAGRGAAGLYVDSLIVMLLMVTAV